MNFSRKYRPKTFEQVVGQDLVKSMLQNSLFLDKVFPAYLFAGQRGCGKTSTARIFAKSLNCVELDNFRKDPKSCNLPCLKCVSCVEMDSQSHPDFFELDAATNSGVDNIRQIIETSFYQPALGARRVFLIDEAHMLSKAAFNSLLKTLEEPPKTVVFLLATTELDKVPLTIRSRAFLSLFPALGAEEMFRFLARMCGLEKIEFEEEALWFLVQQSQGCPRDAQNLLEQAFFCEPKIKLATVQKIFSYCPAAHLIELCRLLFQKDKKAISLFFKNGGHAYSAALMFESLQELLVTVSNLKMGIGVEKGSLFYAQDEQLGLLAGLVSGQFLRRAMRLFWDQQRNFAQIAQKESYLLFLLLELCDEVVVNKVAGPELKTGVGTSSLSVKSSASELLVDLERPGEVSQKKSVGPSVFGLEPDKRPVSSGELEAWRRFLKTPDLQKNRMLCSSLSACEGVRLDQSAGEVIVFLARANKFLESMLKDLDDVVKLHLPAFFPNISKIRVVQSKKTTQVSGVTGVVSGVVGMKRLEKKDFSDKEEWPKVNLMLKYFPGSVTVETKK